MVNLIVRCPQCPDLRQATSVPRERLKQMIEADDKITAFGSICGHRWAFTDEEKQSIREALDKGKL
jgi:hypothetical protein